MTCPTGHLVGAFSVRWMHQCQHPYDPCIFGDLVNQAIALMHDPLTRAADSSWTPDHRELSKLGSSLVKQFVHMRCGSWTI